jgi:tubulin polyglutamylase TTLL4
MASMLNILTPDDVRVLVETVDEESRCGSYELVFPTASSHKYLEFMDQPRYYNLLLDAWLRKYHTFSSTDGNFINKLYSE